MIAFNQDSLYADFSDTKSSDTVNSCLTNPSVVDLVFIHIHCHLIVVYSILHFSDYYVNFVFPW